MEEESLIAIERSELYYKTHFLNSDDAVELGIEKSIILHTIDKFFYLKTGELFKEFPYIEKERFYKLLKELIDSGHLRIKEVTNE